jgi:hypothetical protein
MKPVIHETIIHDGYTNRMVNLRAFEPEDEEAFSETLFLDIGEKGKKGADTYTITVATPKGLLKRIPENGILAERPLLVMAKYNFQELWQWLEKILARCEGAQWSDCHDRLKCYFAWEYDDYKKR